MVNIKGKFTLLKQSIQQKLTRIQTSIKEEKDKKSMVKTILYELWLTFKKPLFFTAMAGLAILIVIPVATYFYFVRDLTSKEQVLNRKNAGVILLDRSGKPFFTFYEAKEKKLAAFSDIPQYTKDAVIAVEDQEYYTHPGFSIEGIGRAVLTNLREEELAYGGSTITQQLVKNALLTPEKTFLRKYQELILAVEIERRFSKDDILEMYLNTVYFGEGAFGIENAALGYFSKPAKDLTLAQSTLLAGILPAPSAYSPLSGDREKALRRQKIVLQKMREQGYITQQEEGQARQEVITFNPEKKTLNVTAPHFALMVKDELIKKYGEQKVANSGFRVTTTLDLTKQEYAEEAVLQQVERLNRNNVSNGAAVAINPKNGEIIALVGSKDWSDEIVGKINLAITPRQVGSSFKPIIYAKAFEDRLITPATVLTDEQTTFSDNYKPKNYDGKYRGKILARFALANSLNIPAVEVMQKVGVPKGLEIARRLGITTLSNNPSDYGLSLVLGTGEVPLIEMASAFGTFGNKGERIKPTSILTIHDKNGNEVYRYSPSGDKVLDESVAFQISAILSDNNARKDVFGSSLTISLPAAVKTGTTEDYRDALTIGYTPSLVVGVWIGNNDNSPMDRIAGSLGAAPIWRNMMNTFLQGTPIDTFVMPFTIAEEKVCKANGLKAQVATESAYTEFFLPGTQPTELCEEAKTPTQTPTPTATPEPSPTEIPSPTPQPSATITPSPTILLSPTSSAGLFSSPTLPPLLTP